MKSWLVILALLATAALAQSPEYTQVCPTSDCVARDAWQSRTATTGIAHETAVAGYVRNLITGSNAVALFGLSTQEVAGASWGLNTLLQDSQTRTAHGSSGRLLVGAELDFNVMSPNTRIIGVSIGGNSLAQSTNANGFIVSTLGNGNRWTTGFLSADYAAENALFVGATTTTESQRIMFRSGPQVQILQADNGTLRLYSSGANGLRVEWGGVTADTFTPTVRQVLPDTATNAEIVQALRKIGLVR